LKIEGTFPLDTIKYPTGEDAPDVLVSLRWSPALNTNGAPGLVTSVGGTIGKGTHGSLSRFDMNNTLVASGPDFKRGLVNHTPSGNIDVAPTVLWLLGVKAPATMDGRVLHEALVHSTTPAPAPEVKTIEAKCDVGLFHW